MSEQVTDTVIKTMRLEREMQFRATYDQGVKDGFALRDGYPEAAPPPQPAAPTSETFKNVDGKCNCALYPAGTLDPCTECAIATPQPVSSSEPVAFVPVGQMLPSAWNEKEEPWCREVLLYSPNNNGDLFRGKQIRETLYRRATMPAPQAAEPEHPGYKALYESAMMLLEMRDRREERAKRLGLDAGPATPAVEPNLPDGWRVEREPRNVLALYRRGTAQPTRFEPGETIHRLLFDIIEPWDDNPDGIKPGEVHSPRMNRDTGQWEG